MTKENLDFGRGHNQKFDHLTMVILKFRPWSWSKIFDHMTMTPGRRPNGQKIMVALPPPNLQTFVVNVQSDVFSLVMKPSSCLEQNTWYCMMCTLGPVRGTILLHPSEACEHQLSALLCTIDGESHDINPQGTLFWEVYSGT